MTILKGIDQTDEGTWMERGDSQAAGANGVSGMKVEQPSLFSMELAEEICDRVAEGQTLEQIVRDEEMPCRHAVWVWLKIRSEFNHMLLHTRVSIGQRGYSILS